MGKPINTIAMTARKLDAATIPVRLLEAKQFESGVMLLRYQPNSVQA